MPTRTNRRTGEVQELRDGQWVTTTPASQGAPAFSIKTRGANPLLPGQVQGQGLNNTGQSLHNRKDEATLPYDVRKASADASAAELQLRQDRIAAGLDADTGKPVAQPNDPNGGPSGAAFLKTLSASDQRLVKAMAEGRMIPPTGRAAASPYWQKLLGQTLQYDPSFDAIDYGARYNTRKDFTSGQSSRNIKALNTAIGHVSQLADQISGTASHGGFPFATTVNRAENAYARGSGDPGITKFTQTAGAVSSELTQVFRGTGGAEADVQRYLSELDPNASADQKKAAVGNILGLLKSRLDAINDQYSKGMGTASQGLDVLDEHSKAALTKYLPGYVPPQAPGTPPPPTGPRGLGPNPGDHPGTTDYSSMGGPINSQVGGFDTSLRDVVGGQKKDEFDPEWTGFVDNMVRSKTPYRQAIKQLTDKYPGSTLSPTVYSNWLRYLDKHPDYKGGISYGTKQVPVGLSERAGNFISSSKIGATAGHFANSFTAGLPELAAGDKGAYWDAISRQQHPTLSTVGDIGGTVGGALTLNKLLGPVLEGAPAVGDFFGAAKAAANPLTAEFAPGIAAARQGLTTDALFGGASGAIHNPDHPVAGAAGGALAMAGGNVLGRYTLGPALGAAGETGPGQFLANTALKGANKLGGLFGGGGGVPPAFSPPAALDAGESLLVKKGGKTLGDITGRMQEAKDLGMPFALADANPQLRALAGSASRKSPDVRALAEDVIGSRQMGQAERAIGLIDHHLAPSGDVPTMKADAMTRAQAASQPLYEKAMAHPAPDDHALSGLLSTPAGESAAREAYTIALNKGENPAELSFSLDHTGNPVIHAKPNWRTLQYMKMGVDSIVEKARDPVTGKLNLNDPASRALDDFRKRFVGRLGDLNPDYRAANQAYGHIIDQGSAAERGYGATAPRVSPEQTQVAIGNTRPESLPHFRRGYAGSLTDTVERTRLARDPYETIYGSPAQQSKMGIVFPEGADRFGRARGLERDMSKTHHELLGGSDTQARGQADKMFDSPGAEAIADIGTSIATGTPPIKTLGRLAMKMGDMKRLGVRGAQSKADQVGPLLLDTDPANNLLVLSDLIARRAQRQGYAYKARTLGGLLGAPLTYGAYQQ